MFIGDGGTMVMGLLMGWYVIRTLSSDNAESIEDLAANGRELGLVAMMVAVAIVPVADTLRVMTARPRPYSAANNSKRDSHLRVTRHHGRRLRGAAGAVAVFCLLISGEEGLRWYVRRRRSD